MKEKEELVKENQQPIYIMAQPNIQEDEIDLFELGVELWKKKIVIIAITAIVTIITILYTSTIPKIYEANAAFIPVNKYKLEHLNSILRTLYKNNSDNNIIITNTNTNTNIISKNMLATLFLSKINNKQLRKELFEKKGYESIHNNGFIITVEKEKKTEIINKINVKLKNENPKKLAEIVTATTKYCEEKATEQLIKDILSQVKSEQYLLESKISGLRNNALTNFTNKLKKAESAYLIAKKAGLTDFIVAENKEIYLEMGYLKGTKVLSAEIEEIKKKLSLKNTGLDAFIGVSELLLKLEQLKAIKIDPNSIKTVIVDTAAYTPTSPIATKKCFNDYSCLFSRIYFKLFLCFISIIYK